MTSQVFILVCSFRVSLYSRLFLLSHYTSDCLASPVPLKSTDRFSQSVVHASCVTCGRSTADFRTVKLTWPRMAPSVWTHRVEDATPSKLSTLALLEDAMASQHSSLGLEPNTFLQCDKKQNDIVHSIAGLSWHLVSPREKPSHQTVCQQPI